MKDLYKQFNDIDIDVSEFEEAPVSEIEKAQYKREVRTRMKKKTTNKWLKGVAAACLSVGIGGAALVGLSYTTYAQEIPILNSMFSFFSAKEKTISDSVAYTEPQNITLENDGVTITVTESLFDSNKFYIGYTIETPVDLGDEPRIQAGFTLNGQMYVLQQDDYHLLEKVGEQQYNGLSIATLPLSTTLQEANFEFFVTELKSADEQHVLTGDWRYELHAKAVENKTQTLTDASVGQDSLGIDLQTITYTPFSFTVKYEQSIFNEPLKNDWKMIISYLAVTDDLGNTYSARPDGGFGDQPGIMTMSFTFGKLHPEAKQLIFTPTYRLFQPADGSDKQDAITLPDIIVDIEK